MVNRGEEHRPAGFRCGGKHPDIVGIMGVLRAFPNSFDGKRVDQTLPTLNVEIFKLYGLSNRVAPVRLMKPSVSTFEF